MHSWSVPEDRPPAQGQNQSQTNSYLPRLFDNLNVKTRPADIKSVGLKERTVIQKEQMSAEFAVCSSKRFQWEDNSQIEANDGFWGSERSSCERSTSGRMDREGIGFSGRRDRREWNSEQTELSDQQGRLSQAATLSSTSSSSSRPSLKPPISPACKHQIKQLRGQRIFQEAAKKMAPALEHGQHLTKGDDSARLLLHPRHRVNDGDQAQPFVLEADSDLKDSKEDWNDIVKKHMSPRPIGDMTLASDCMSSSTLICNIGNVQRLLQIVLRYVGNEHDRDCFTHQGVFHGGRLALTRINANDCDRQSESIFSISPNSEELCSVEDVHPNMLLAINLLFSVIACCSVDDAKQYKKYSLIALATAGQNADVAIWVFAVDGLYNSLQRFMTRFSRQGAVRLDLDDACDVKNMPLGEGTSATVLLATKRNWLPAMFGEREHRYLAVKALSTSRVDVETSVAAEIAMLTKIQQHPNVIAFLGLFWQPVEGKTIGCWSILFERYSGGDFHDYVAAKGPCDLHKAKTVLSGLASALRHVHGRRVLHRDVKAENLLLTKSRVVLTDFGVAVSIDNEIGMSTRSGTPGYAAPEVITGKKYGFKADVFGAGVVFHFAITGKLPFRADSIPEVLRKTCAGVTDTADLKRFKSCEPLMDLIKMMLTRNQHKRISVCQLLKHRWLTGERPHVMTLDPSLLGAQGCDSNEDDDQRDGCAIDTIPPAEVLDGLGLETMSALKDEAGPINILSTSGEGDRLAIDCQHAVQVEGQAQIGSMSSTESNLQFMGVGLEAKPSQPSDDPMENLYLAPAHTVTTEFSARAPPQELNACAVVLLPVLQNPCSDESATGKTRATPLREPSTECESSNSLVSPTASAASTSALKPMPPAASGKKDKGAGGSRVFRWYTRLKDASQVLRPRSIVSSAPETRCERYSSLAPDSSYASSLPFVEGPVDEGHKQRGEQREEQQRQHQQTTTESHAQCPETEQPPDSRKQPMLPTPSSVATEKDPDMSTNLSIECCSQIITPATSVHVGKGAATSSGASLQYVSQDVKSTTMQTQADQNGPGFHPRRGIVAANETISSAQSDNHLVDKPSTCSTDADCNPRSTRRFLRNSPCHFRSETRASGHQRYRFQRVNACNQGRLETPSNQQRGEHKCTLAASASSSTAPESLHVPVAKEPNPFSDALDGDGHADTRMSLVRADIDNLCGRCDQEPLLDSLGADNQEETGVSAGHALDLDKSYGLFGFSCIPPDDTLEPRGTNSLADTVLDVKHGRMIGRKPIFTESEDSSRPSFEHFERRTTHESHFSTGMDSFPSFGSHFSTPTWSRPTFGEDEYTPGCKSNDQKEHRGFNVSESLAQSWEDSCRSRNPGLLRALDNSCLPFDGQRERTTRQSSDCESIFSASEVVFSACNSEPGGSFCF